MRSGLRAPAPAAVLSAVLLSLGLLVGCEGSQDRPDYVVVDSSTQVSGEARSIRLPTGLLTLTTGAAQDDDETTYVPVHWSFDPNAVTQFPGGEWMFQQPQATTLTAETDGRSVELPTPYDVAERGLLPRDSTVRVRTGAGGALKILVAYDGVTQTLDAASGDLDTGAAAPLYDAPPQVSSRCGGVVVTGQGGLARASAEPRCEIELQSVAYLPGTGWAPAGEAFPVVTYEVGIREISVGADFELGRGEVDLEVSGQQPVGVLAGGATVDGEDADTLRGTLAFAATAQEVRVDVRATFAGRVDQAAGDFVLTAVGASS